MDDGIDYLFGEAVNQQGVPNSCTTEPFSCSMLSSAPGYILRNLRRTALAVFAGRVAVKRTSTTATSFSWVNASSGRCAMHQISAFPPLERSRASKSPSFMGYLLFCILGRSQLYIYYIISYIKKQKILIFSLNYSIILYI